MVLVDYVVFVLYAAFLIVLKEKYQILVQLNLCMLIKKMIPKTQVKKVKTRCLVFFKELLSKEDENNPQKKT